MSGKSPSQPAVSVRKKIAHVNDILGDLFAVLEKVESENTQLQKVVHLLLHFKYMLQFVVKNSVFGKLWNMEQIVGQAVNVTDFKVDYDDCLANFAGLSQELPFIRQMEHHYKKPDDSQYYLYKKLANAHSKEAPVSQYRFSAIPQNVPQTPIVASTSTNRESSRKTKLIPRHDPEPDDASLSDCQDFLELEYGSDDSSVIFEDETMPVPKAKSTPSVVIAQQPTPLPLLVPTTMQPNTIPILMINGAPTHALVSTSTPNYTSTPVVAPTKPSKSTSKRISSLRAELKRSLQEKTRKESGESPQKRTSTRKKKNLTSTPLTTKSVTRSRRESPASSRSQLKASTSKQSVKPAQPTVKERPDQRSSCGNTKTPNGKPYHQLFSPDRQTSTDRSSNCHHFLANTSLYKQLQTKKPPSIPTTEITLSNDENGSLAGEEYIVLDSDSLLKSIDVALFIEVRHEEGGKQFACSIPGCGYVSQKRLFTETHLLKHFALKPFGCSSCEYRTDLEIHLKSHSTRRHQIPAELYPYMKYFTCQLNSSHSSSHYTCQLTRSCQFTTNQGTSLLEHIQQAHLEAKVLKCAHCEARFSAMKAAQGHLWTDHAKERIRHLKRRRLSCPYGHCTFTIEKMAEKCDMLSHIMESHSFSEKVNCQLNGNTKRSLADDGSFQLSTKRRRTDLLDISTDVIQSQGSNPASDGGPYVCSYKNCRFTVSTWEELKYHEYGYHMKPIFTCSPCSGMVAFRRKEELDEHLLEAHGQSPFICGAEDCGRAFVNARQLKRHLTEDHPGGTLVCSICQKACQATSFTSRHGMMKHYRENHIEGEYRCTADPSCTFVGRYQVELERHPCASNRKQSKCTECGVLVNRLYITTHMKRHNNVKDHVCSWPECGKTFVDRKSLRDHVRIHVGCKRFKCKYPGCPGYASEQRSNTIKHIRIKHFKLPPTLHEQMEQNLSSDQNAGDYLETLPDNVPF